MAGDQATNLQIIEDNFLSSFNISLGSDPKASIDRGLERVVKLLNDQSEGP